MNKDYYDILGVPQNTSKDEIKRAYYILAAQFHPDKPLGSEMRFKDINEAYRILSHSESRVEYDRKRKLTADNLQFITNEEHKETVESTESSSQTTDTNETQQSAQADLKMAAERAKSATVGFDFQKLFVGRIDHMNYLYAAVASIALSFTVGMIPLIGLLLSLLLCVLGVGLTIRRFHDIHITGWATLILIIPIVGFIAVIYLCWKKGDIATNPYGAVPDAKRDFFKAVLNT